MWFLFALLSAIFSGLSIIINKKALQKVNPTVVTWALFIIPIPFLIIGSINSPKPQINHLFFLGIVSSSIVFILAKTLTLKMMKDGLLSRLIPLGAFSTLFNYFIGLLILNENIRITALIGIGAIIIGVYIFNIEDKKRWFDPFVLLYKDFHARIYMIAMLLTSFASLFDKISITNIIPSNPYLPYLGENLIMGSVMTAYLSFRNKQWVKQVKNHFPILVLAGLIYMGVGLTVFLGFSNGFIVLVTAIKKLEIVVVLLLSYLFFHDKPSKYSILGTLFMIIGVILIKAI